MEPTFVIQNSEEEKGTDLALRELNTSHNMDGSTGDLPFASNGSTVERDSFGRGGSRGVQVQRETHVDRSI